MTLDISRESIQLYKGIQEINILSGTEEILCQSVFSKLYDNCYQIHWGYPIWAICGIKILTLLSSCLEVKLTCFSEYLLSSMCFFPTKCQVLLLYCMTHKAASSLS